MRRFELLVFDWDGTLSDSTGAIVHSIQQAFASLGLPVPESGKARHIIGLGLEEAFAYLAPDLPKAEYRRVTDQYRSFFLRQSTPLYAGSADLLSDLKSRGFQLAIATGKSSRGLERALSELGLTRLFSAWRCADQCASKPAPDMLIELMEEFDLAPEATLMIGDTTHDLQMAANASVPAIGICHGAHSRDALQSLTPLACVESTMELTEWLQTNA